MIHLSIFLARVYKLITGLWGLLPAIALLNVGVYVSDMTMTWRDSPCGGEATVNMAFERGCC